MKRRHFLAALAAACSLPSRSFAQAAAPQRILLRSSWQTVNIGDIAHTPGMLALLEQHHPEAQVTLWPSPLSEDVRQLLKRRFPKLTLAQTAAEQQQALKSCDFFLHGSGPGLVGKAAAEQARRAGKPYGFAGVTLNDQELADQRELLAGAKFVFCRDTDSLRALQKSGIKGPQMEFGPDATFALDLRDEAAANKLLQHHELPKGKFLCAVPRLRWTPYWEIRPERTKPDPAKIAVNEEFAEKDHAKQREAIVAWVRELGLPVLLCPEMTYQVPLLRPLLFEKLPADVQPQVKVMDRYWLTAEAASVYARAAVVLSFEMHSPIIAIAGGTPAIHLRQPTDTRKGQMWRDVGLEAWLFEIDDATGEQIAAPLLAIGRDLPAARTTAAKARELANERMGQMVGAMG